MVIRNSILAVVDQGVVSSGNFLTNIFLARVLTPNDYGVFVTLFGIMFLLNGAHTAIVVYPLLLKAAVAQQPSDLGPAISGGFIVTGIFAATSVTFLGFSCFRLHRWDLLSVAAAALILWQLQETCRKGLTSRSQFRQAFLGDAVSYLGQFLAVVLLWRLNQLTLFNIFGVIAVTSLAALAIQMTQIGFAAPTIKIAREAVSRSARLGKWALLTHFAATPATIQMYVWILGVFFASGDAAIIQALGNVLSTVSPFVLAMSSVSVPAGARSMADKGLIGAWDTTRRYGILFAVPVLSYYVLLIFLPYAALSLFYGPNNHYLNSTSMLRWLAFFYVLTFIAQVVGDFLRAIERVQVDFMANAGTSIVAMVAWFIGSVRCGPLVSAPFSLMLAGAFRTAVLCWWRGRIAGQAHDAEISIMTSA